MKIRTMASKSWMATTVAVLLMAGASTSYGAALNTKMEVKCFDALAKAASKHQAAVAKAMAKCRDGVIAGTILTSCPDSTAQAAIEKSAASITKGIVAKCKSTCSISGADCIDNLFCPPNGATPENCTAGAKALPFHSSAMGFPGSYCEAVIGGKLTDGNGLGKCIAGLGTMNGDRVIGLVYGSLDHSTAPGKDASKCLAAIAKALPKSAGKMTGAVAKCRNTQLGGDPAVMGANDCPTADVKTAESLAKEVVSLEGTIDKSCTNATIQELDICNAGVGGITTLADAKICLDRVLSESAYSTANAEDREYVDISLVNAAYPSTTTPRCGDGLVNQIPSQFFRSGEECDGADDSACPGHCIAPGDVYQCTCSTIKRMQTFATGATADLDNGWSGASHNSKVTQGAGFVADVDTSSCNCSEFDATDKATCVAGHSTDPVCDVHGSMGPRCSYAPYDGIACDVHGNNNGVNNNQDCQVCDENSTNAGDWCQTELDCGSQCFSPAGAVTGLCEKQSDCTAPDICRGRCDKESGYCNILSNGGPLPLSSQGTSVCVNVQYFSDVTGTRNIVTGEHALFMQMRSVTFLAQSSSRPCPICGGFCTAPGTKIGEICEGTCSGPSSECRGGVNKGTACASNTDCPASSCQGIACRFDSDCTTDPGATCDAASPECLGNDCQLSLMCAGGDKNGRACRIESETAFGTTSADCPPPVATNISGSGLAIHYWPLTSESVELENPGTCDTPGYENLNGCYCVSGGGGTRNLPNRCAPACTAAGANYGRGCAGNYTTCDGGTEDGAICDEDSDCSGGGHCTANPTTCYGGTNDGGACADDGNCPGGSCADACSGGICTKLCKEKGVCSGGANNGLGCSVAYACPGGTCVVTDPEEGACAAGPNWFHCSGPGWEYRTCSPDYQGTQNGCENGVDNIPHTDDDFVGADTCISDVANCFVNNGHAEGGDTLNGQATLQSR